jgi:hypothetical protein
MFRQVGASFGGPRRPPIGRSSRSASQAIRPASFAQEPHPEQMRFRARAFRAALKAGGYLTAPLETALRASFAGPMLLPVMRFWRCHSRSASGSAAFCGDRRGLSRDGAQIATAFSAGAGVLSCFRLVAEHPSPERLRDSAVEDPGPGVKPVPTSLLPGSHVAHLLRRGLVDRDSSPRA